MAAEMALPLSWRGDEAECDDMQRSSVPKSTLLDFGL